MGLKMDLTIHLWICTFDSMLRFLIWVIHVPNLIARKVSIHNRIWRIFIRLFVTSAILGGCQRTNAMSRLQSRRESIRDTRESHLVVAGKLWSGPHCIVYLWCDAIVSVSWGGSRVCSTFEVMLLYCVVHTWCVSVTSYFLSQRESYRLRREVQQLTDTGTCRFPREMFNTLAPT